MIGLVCFVCLSTSIVLYSDYEKWNCEKQQVDFVIIFLFSLNSDDLLKTEHHLFQKAASSVLLFKSLTQLQPSVPVLTRVLILCPLPIATIFPFLKNERYLKIQPHRFFIFKSLTQLQLPSSQCFVPANVFLFCVLSRFLPDPAAAISGAAAGDRAGVQEEDRQRLQEYVILSKIDLLCV